MSTTSVSTKDLHKSLGRKELFSVAAGQIIGAGIMALTGVAIALTGRSANLAFMLAALAVVAISIPTIFLASSVRLRGGQYTQAAVFVGKKFAGMFIIIFIVSNISLAMYAVSFADYFLALVPGIPTKLIAVIVLTIIFIVNYFGVGKAAFLQTIMVIVLAIALACFTAFGLFKVEPGYFQNPGFITNGLTGLLTAMAFLTFATGGAAVILNLSAEAKNAKKDIPFVIIVSTIAIALLYALMSTVAAGVLPIEQVAGQPLTVVAKEIMPTWIYVFFVVGGAMFALISTLNAQVSWITKPIMQACVDNWFPKSFAKLHPKYNTPYRLLIVYYIIGMIPILTEWDIEFIANSALILLYVSLFVVGAGVLRLPKLFPEQWNNSPFHVNTFWFYTFNIIGLIVLVIQTLLLAQNLSKWGLIGNVVVLILAVIFGIVRNNKVDMEISVENE
ncbi:amino acid permease [Alkalibaculum sp. M08DMB]|uniref:Amino acid permease n=1 Tax=Alkalibaculum sporogenes TaxID=2655001 RepID=A0A6A7K9D9_9FIRM|nr:amino acid permease [Alkalibaculum sporogenes]MPW26129.1 amino acid permease [Alkalibaculum sporogenes]